MIAYYNEFDPYASQWLRNLIAAGHIAPGDVDERSIEDVHPDDLRGYKQCHFFAGIGVWSYSLRAAGWADDRPVWTGSCPCQPFSAAGKGLAFADERHLWPAFDWLISECKPAIVLGEQVASSPVDDWIDLVQADLEALGYAFGSVSFPSAGVGAPHIRDRNYWCGILLASANDTGLERRRLSSKRAAKFAAGPRGLADRLGNADGARWQQGWASAAPAGYGDPIVAAGDIRRMADLQIIGCERELLRASGGLPPFGTSDIGSAGGLANTIMQQRPDGECGIRNVNAEGGRVENSAALAGFCSDSGLAYSSSIGREMAVQHAGSSTAPSGEWEASRLGMHGAFDRPGPTNGFWRDADWLHCTDGRWRPVEPGTLPLVASTAGSVGRGRTDWQAPAEKEGFGHRAGRLKGYGNAINAKAAQAWIETVMECMP